MPNISQKTKREQTLRGKKILFLITQTKWGGAQKYVLELAEHFVKHNEVHIAYGQVKDKNKRFFDTCDKLNIKTIAIPSLVRNIDLGKDFLAVPEVSKIYNKGLYSLVHINSSKASLVASIAAKMYSMNPLNVRLRVIYTAHGFVFNEPLSKTKKKLYKMSEKISTNFQDAIITVSETDKQSALDNKIVADFKLFTIHNGINPDSYSFLTKEEALNKLGLNSNRKYFGTIASFYTTKGYTYLIEAIKLLKDSPLLDNHRWILMGDGPELEKIKQEAKEIDKYVKFIGPRENGWQYLKAFNYFILPSVKEGLPYTILEAGLAKVPVIATKVGGISEILEDNKTGLVVTPANPIQLADAMKQIIKAELAEKLSNENYNNIVKNFNLRDTIRKTEELYLRLF